MQAFVMCPFCRVIFDSLSEPSADVKIDGSRRRAHLRCLPANMPGAKPNGSYEEPRP